MNNSYYDKLTNFKVGDVVSRNETYYRKIYPSDDGHSLIPKIGVVTKVEDLPQESWDAVGHKQWIGIDGDEWTISAAFYDPEARFGGAIWFM